MTDRIGHTAKLLTEKWNKKIFQCVFQPTRDLKTTDPSRKGGNSKLLNPFVNSGTDLCCGIRQETKHLVCICKPAQTMLRFIHPFKYITGNNPLSTNISSLREKSLFQPVCQRHEIGNIMQDEKSENTI